MSNNFRKWIEKVVDLKEWIPSEMGKVTSTIETNETSLNAWKIENNINCDVNLTISSRILNFYSNFSLLKYLLNFLVKRNGDVKNFFGKGNDNDARGGPSSSYLIKCNYLYIKYVLKIIIVFFSKQLFSLNGACDY